MGVIDSHGRLFGRARLIDLALLLLACGIGVLGYRRLAPGYRIAPPFQGGEEARWIAVKLQLPAEAAFLCDVLTPDLTATDPRTGAPIARIQGCVSTQPPRVALELCAAQDPQGRWFHRNAQLLPGEHLRIETPACIVEGILVQAEQGEFYKPE